MKNLMACSSNRINNTFNDQYIDVLEGYDHRPFSASIDTEAQEVMTLLEGKDKGYREILKEYWRLAVMAELSPDLDDKHVARLDLILAKAETDLVLTFLIGEIDYFLGQQMGLLSPEKIDEYTIQQARLSEHLAVGSPDPDFHRMLQLRLRGMGLYNGPIDGVLGQRSREAVREFQKSQAVQVDGIPGPKTVSILLTKIGMNADE
jgi:hypothetical protein